MKKQWRNGICLAMCTLLLCGLTPVQAYANSAQMRWSGKDATGVIINGENGETCPIMVEEEVLTFDIPEFPKGYYPEKEEYLAYSAKVTAEYIFYNPADYTVTATLVFPFGNEPDYAYYERETEGQKAQSNIDAEKYDILVNGQPIEKTIRHTLSYSYSRFRLSKDMALLLEEYYEDAFYRMDMPVTKYVYTASGVDTGKYSAANVAFDVPKGDTQRKIYFVNQSGFHTQDDGDGRVSAWVENGDEIVVYVIGTPFEVLPEWKFYEDGGVEDKEEIDGTMTYESGEMQTMTLKEFALLGWSQETGVSEKDWYNAVLAEMAEDETHTNYGILSLDRYRRNFSGGLMRWYEYEITLAPGERLVNTVTAPMYPGINLDYEPPVYYYTYLLSPAKLWAGFGSLQVIIKTPYYVVDSSLGELIRMENGDYMMFYDGLPDGECEFTLSASADPERSGGYGSPGGRSILRPVILVVGVGLCIFGLIRNLRKKKKKDA